MARMVKEGFKNLKDKEICMGTRCTVIKILIKIIITVVSIIKDLMCPRH